MKFRTMMQVLAALLLGGLATPAVSQVTAEILAPSLTSDTIVFTATLSNPQSFNSGPLRYELWAAAAPYPGAGTPTGYKVWQKASAGGEVLGPTTSRGEPVLGTFPPPPDGTYYFVVVVTEFRGGPIDDGYVPVGYHSYSDSMTYPVSSTPQAGLWWNPSETGSGYFIDLQHGVVVVTTYSYNADGSPQWYLMTGTLTGSNTVSGPLTKFRAGQCIACAYTAPIPNGNDGTMSIAFTSARTATVTVSGGRTFTISMPSY